MAVPQPKTAVTYYIIRDGRPPNAIIAIHRVYDSAVACFQMLMNAGVESIDMWGVGTNDRGLSITEWVLHSYTRSTTPGPGTLHQHGVAGIHNEERIPPLRAPIHSDKDTSAGSTPPAACQ